nr:hypothetical protein ZK6.5 - Caenorhabditis elegans [Caenorhabditis elegans]
MYKYYLHLALPFPLSHLLTYSFSLSLCHFDQLKIDPDLVPSCNACKIFFRRLITRTAPVKQCYIGEHCFTKSPITKKCTFCRFQKCIQVGMTLPSYLHFGELTKEKCIDSTIQKLILMEAHRKDLMANYYTSYLNPTIDEVIRLNKVEYTRKSQNHQMSFYNWAFHCCLVTVDFMKKFSFVNLLRFEDQKNLMKEFYIKLTVLINSKQSMSCGKEGMTFPDGSDVLPPTSSEWGISKISQNLENKVRCRLIGRLSELRITDEEYLLINFKNFQKFSKILITFSSVFKAFYNFPRTELSKIVSRKIEKHFQSTKILQIFPEVSSIFQKNLKFSTTFQNS